MKKLLNTLLVITLTLLLFSCRTTVKEKQSAPAVIEEKTEETTITESAEEEAPAATVTEAQNTPAEAEPAETVAPEKDSIIVVSTDESADKVDVVIREEDEIPVIEVITDEESKASEVTEEEDGPQEETVLPVTPIVRGETDSTISIYSYAYGVKNMNDLIESGIPFVSQYFMRGMYDASLDEKRPVFITLGNLQNVINEYYTLYITEGVSVEHGKRPENVEYLLSLPEPSDETELFSYAYGFSVIRDLKGLEIDIDIIPFMAGMLDALYSETSPLTEEEINDAYNLYILYLNEEYYAQQEKMAEANRLKAEEFLRGNSTEDGITVLDNGVQILLLDSDEKLGGKPTQYDTVIMDYNEYILDYETGELEFTDADWNAEVSVISLSSGLQSAVTNMHVGEAIRAFIPPEYSGLSEGDGEDIEPNSLFVYDIALQKIL